VTDLLQVGAGAYAAIFAFALAGAAIQGSIGYGLNLVVVPVTAAVAPAALPAALIIMALPMTAGSALLEYRHIDRSAVLWLSVGRLPGVVLGAWVVTALTAEMLAVVTGGIVVVAAAMSVASPDIRISRTSSSVAGLVAGVMGTASSIGGPPIAILLQHQSGPVLRSTTGAAFLIGILMSLAALIVAGEVEPHHWVLGLGLTPAIALGLYLSRFTHARLDDGWLRPCVLGFAGLSGMGVLLRGLL
jgi:uncharacterized membrane protein YfcA